MEPETHNWTDKVTALVDAFFDDIGTTERWMRAMNPLLGGLSPDEMISSGRGEKLFNFVKTQLEENKPDEKKEEVKEKVELHPPENFFEG